MSALRKLQVPERDLTSRLEHLGFAGPSPLEALQRLAEKVELACARSPRGPLVHVDHWDARAIREILAVLSERGGK